MDKNPNNYECMFIINTAIGDENIPPMVEKFTSLIAENGEVEKVDEWGKRRLAYEINRVNEGYYVLVNFKSPSEFPEELHRVMGITDGILRCLIIRR